MRFPLVMWPALRSSWCYRGLILFLRFRVVEWVLKNRYIRISCPWVYIIEFLQFTSHGQGHGFGVISWFGCIAGGVNLKLFSLGKSEVVEGCLVAFIFRSLDVHTVLELSGWPWPRYFDTTLLYVLLQHFLLPSMQSQVFVTRAPSFIYWSYVTMRTGLKLGA